MLRCSPALKEVQASECRGVVPVLDDHQFAGLQVSLASMYGTADTPGMSAGGKAAVIAAVAAACYAGFVRPRLMRWGGHR